MKPWAIAAADVLLDSVEDRIDVEMWLARYLEKTEDMSTFEADELAPALLPDLHAALDEQFRVHNRRGLTPPAFRWSDPVEQRFLIKSAGWNAPLDIEDRVRRDRDGIRMLFPKLEPTDFEHVCAHLLAIYGAVNERTHVTKRSGDGGFDFVGLLEPSVLPGPRRLGSQPWRIAGQAKLYTHDIDSDTVEAFGSRTEKWRLGGGDGWDQVPKWFRESPHPMLGLFITTSGLARAARRSAPQRVVLYLEGDQVAEDLAWSSDRSAWVDSETDEIDPVKFVDYFREKWTRERYHLTAS